MQEARKRAGGEDYQGEHDLLQALDSRHPWVVDLSESFVCLVRADDASAAMAVGEERSLSATASYLHSVSQEPPSRKDICQGKKCHVVSWGTAAHEVLVIDDWMRPCR